MASSSTSACRASKPRRRSSATSRTSCPNGLATANTYIWAVENDGRVVGTVFVGVRDGGAWLYDITIAEGERGKGYGRAAMTALEDEVRALGHDTIGLNVWGSNEVARGLLSLARLRRRVGAHAQARLDRVLDRDELPLEREPLGEVARERLHAEPLGRVVAGGDEVDPELTGGLQARLLGLAGEEEVVAFVRCPDQLAAGAARADRDPLDPLRPVREDERLAADDLRGCGPRTRRCPSALRRLPP